MAIKTYPRGLRKEFNLRCCDRIIHSELKEFYKLRQRYDKFDIEIDEGDLVLHLSNLLSVVRCLHNEILRTKVHYQTYVRAKRFKKGGVYYGKEME